MNDEKEILDILDNIKFDEHEFDSIDIELNHMEKKRIRKNYKKKILGKSSLVNSAVIAAGLIVVIFLGRIAAPAMASNIPIISNIYDSLGIYSEYKDYTKYIGETTKAGKYEYSIEEFMVTPYKSLLGIKIKSDNVIPENHQGFMVGVEIDGVHWDSGSSKEYRVDDHTLILTEEHNYNNKVSKKANIKVDIHSIDSNDNTNETIGRFEFKANFDRSYTEFKSMGINNVRFEKYGIELSEINSSIMGTNIVSKIQSREKDEEEYLAKNDKLEYVLNVDDKFYGGDKYSSVRSGIFGIKGLTMTQINNLKFNQVDNAKDISLLVYEAKYTQDELFEIGINDDAKSDNIIERGVSYSKEYKFEDGTVGMFYDLERTNETINVHYKGKENDILLLSQKLRIYSDKNKGKYYYPTIYKNPNLEGDFIIEFMNVLQDDMLLNMTYGFNVHNEYTFIGEYKIK